MILCSRGEEIAVHRDDREGMALFVFDMIDKSTIDPAMESVTT